LRYSRCGFGDEESASGQCVWTNDAIMRYKNIDDFHCGCDAEWFGNANHQAS